MRKKRHGKIPRNRFFIQAILDGFRGMLDLKALLSNPTMFTVAALCAVLFFYFFRDGLLGHWDWFHLIVVMGLFLTWVFASFSVAIALGQGRAETGALRSLKLETLAKRIISKDTKENYETILAPELQIGDLILIEKGDVVPLDGEVIEGVALVDESAVTGESAPVLREAGGDVSALTGGTTLLSDWVVMQVTAKSGEGFLEKMIALVEGAKRSKTPNEKALHVIVSGLCLLFFFATLALPPLVLYMSQGKILLDAFFLASFVVCLIPTTIGGLLPSIGIAGMNRMLQANVLALSPRAIEAAGDVDVLLLDKTGTITLGNRQAVSFFPAPSISLEAITEASYIASLADDTPEGKSIVKLAKEERSELSTFDITNWVIHPFSASKRYSGNETPFGFFKKGAADAIEKDLKRQGACCIPLEVWRDVETISKKGGTPLVVTKDTQVLGAIFLKDIIKPGLKERFFQLRQMGIKTIMVTGDNQLTAAAIAAEAGVDDFLGEASPEKKLEFIRRFQQEGRMVAMTGDGSNDAPALAQADVALAMNNSTQAAREAANLIDLDSNPTKLIEVVHVGKQLLITRGALTTFSIANDLAKYFVLLPVLFFSLSPHFKSWNILNLYSIHSATLSCILFNALIIVLLIPIALRGVRFRATTSENLLKRNLLIWGGVGALFPFLGIVVLDHCLRFLF
jgi:K+-transporting ATPase ATPase B chain